MRILIKSNRPQNFFRYCTHFPSFCPKTLNPKSPPSNSVITSHSSSVSSLLSPSELHPLRNRPFFSISYLRSPSALHFGLHSSICFCNPCSSISNRFSIYFRSLFSPTSLMHSSYNQNSYRCYTISSSNSTAKVCSKPHKLEEEFIFEIVDILQNNEKDIESKLNVLHTRLSIHLITEVFEVLNCRRISGLRFFDWIRSKNLRLRRSAHVCSLIVDNLGRLDDYAAMSTLFKEFTSEKIFLSYVAFRFLSVVPCTDPFLKESTKRVVDLMNGAGGSCRSSGVCALIEMFCKLHMFEMARYVIKVTERKIPYYCLMLRENCKSGLIEDSYNIIKEMNDANCAPNTTVYNYVLGSLWKNSRMNEAAPLLDEMKENGVPFDAITFEILINYVCSIGYMDVVRHLLDQMLSQGLEPRLSSHACIIKSLFAAEKYEGAYRHVVESSIIFKTSSNVVYSLLAKLYKEKGDTMSARNILVEMMDKNLKPDFRIYIKIVKLFRRTGKANLARDLEIRHSKFVIKSRAGLS